MPIRYYRLLQFKPKRLIIRSFTGNHKRSIAKNSAWPQSLTRSSGHLPIGAEVAARLSGLASGLALAVRPAGSAEVSGAQGWVLKIVSAKRLETIFGCP